jgi:type IV pilus assembly protein PilA
MQNILNRMRAKKADEGFTLIELLVVVVIIGVLVAIAVPVYLNYREGAADKSAQSDVRGAVSAIEQWYTDNGNAYPAGTKANSGSPLDNFVSLDSTLKKEIKLSDNTKLTYVGPAAGGTTAGSYKICAQNTGGTDKVYLYDSAAGGSVKAAKVSLAACATAP